MDTAFEMRRQNSITKTCKESLQNPVASGARMWNAVSNSMSESEFRFVCPVCGQHIKCESWRSNTMMECPTCFQRIIVPQSPATDDVELIIKGSKATRRLVTKPGMNLGVPPAPIQPVKDSPVAAIAFVVLLCAVVVVVIVFRGKIFKSTGEETTQTVRPPQAVQTARTKPVSVVTVSPKLSSQTVRIKAGLSAPLTDSEGNTWLPDQSFADGQTISRPNAQIANTKRPELYRSERYGMTSFSYPVPNGKYVVKLHFAETYEGITRPGQRVFSFNVAGHEFKDFDIWAKAGGPNRAYVETVSTEVTNSKVDITFTAKVQSPEINGIEIIPETAGPSVVAPPTNSANWKLDLDAVVIPDSPVAGYIHGKLLIPEFIVLNGDGLTLRTREIPTEAGVSIYLRPNPVESLFGKTVVIKTNTTDAPLVNLRWKDNQGREVQQPQTGYALRIEFGRPVGGQLPGKIYFCAPDIAKSWLMGSFNAEIR